LLLADELDYHKYGMRTPISRFSAFGGPSDHAYEGCPTVSAGPTAGIAAVDDSRSVVESRYPAVVRALTLLWGHPEMNQYFEKVWSGRDPSLSLEPDAMAELMLLAAVHRRVCPYQPAKSVEDFYGAGRWADTWKPARVRR
jgi:hypothetical protein